VGTRAHQLAMYAVYFAPLQMVSDNPQAYAGAPEFQFIKDCPTSWDETKFLGGEPGQWVAVARRKGTDWFVGVMTNEQGRKVEIPLSFLGEGNFRAAIYGDASDADKQPTHVTVTSRNVGSGDVFEAELAPAGGLAMRIVRAP